MRAIARRPWVLVVLAMAVAGSLTGSSSGQGDKKKDDAEQYPFWKTDAGVGVGADAAMLQAWYAAGFAKNGIGILGTRVLLGQHELLVDTDWRFDLEAVPPLDLRALKLIEDHRPFPNVFRKELGVEVKGPDLGWYVAFNEAIRSTAQTHEDNFKHSAKKLENVRYPRLKAMPDKYRGKIITVMGKLAVLHEEEAPRFAGGLKHIYTGWIDGPTKGAPRFVVALTELPEGIEKPSEKLNVEVTFHGYFLSLVRFPVDKKAGRTQKDPEYPYLVGKVVSVQQHKKEVAAQDTPSLSYYYMVTFLGGFLAIALLVVVLNIWLRRGDRLTQAQLAEVRDRQHPFRLEPAGETPAAPPTEETEPKALEPH